MQVITAEGLGKSYRVFDRPHHRLLELLTGRQRHRAFHAVRDVSLEVEEGRGLGIIGENGAGKSTLLKLLSGVTTPTSGTLEVRGRLASILELGSGFHPEFTGRQNLRINAALLGIDPERLDTLTPEILEFSELGRFIDQPVKVYSTGMTMRLAFSIASQVEPEVLVVDEALSVGDGYFQKKCMDKIQDLRAGGTTLVFCSHAMYYVSTFCEEAIWLRQGEVAAKGPTAEVVAAYEDYLAARRRQARRDRAEISSKEGKDDGLLVEVPKGAEDPPSPVPESGSPARLRSTELLGGRPCDKGRTYGSGDSWTIELEWTCDEIELAFHVGVGVNRNDGVEVFTLASHLLGEPAVSGRQHYRARLVVPELPLTKGEFVVHAFLLDESGLHVYDHRLISPAFVVESRGRYEFGLVAIEHRYEVEDAPVGELAS